MIHPRFDRQNLHITISGFTIIELIIVITVMGILITLGTINFRDTQIKSRDAERVADIETLGKYLDIFYTSGTDDAAVAPTFDYPPNTMADGTNITNYLREIDLAVVTAPNADDPSETLKKAETNDQREYYVWPQPDYNEYVYQPLQSDGSLCTTDLQECRKFNLFYKLESDEAVHKFMSKYQ